MKRKPAKTVSELNWIDIISAVRRQDRTAIIFSASVIMDSMRIQVVLLILTLMLFSVLGSGCVNQVPGNVMYQSGSLTFTIRSENAVPDGVLEVAVFRLQDFETGRTPEKRRQFPP